MIPGPFRNRKRVPSPFFGGNLFDEFFQGFQDDLLGGSPGRFGSTDIYEKDGALHYEIELPGMEKGDINIRVRGDRLIVTGEAEREKEEEEANYISRGRSYGKFHRSLPLPDEVENPDELKAKFENGILHIEAKLKESIMEDGYFDVEIE